MSFEDKQITVAVIDSGIKANHGFTDVCITGCSITQSRNGEYQRTNNFDDHLGHGTAVVDELLSKSNSISHIYSIKIYDKTIETDISMLIYALNYVNDYVPCDILLISSGVTYLDYYKDMHSIIEKISHRGTYIISAFDNNGAISFPAAFDSVIGVSVTMNNTEKPRVSVAGPVNVIIPNRFYRLKWVSPPSIIISGSSFAAAHVASLWSKILSQIGRVLSDEQIYSMLANELKLELKKRDVAVEAAWENGASFVKMIKKAVIFPWNKEAHSLARYHKVLPFQIEGFYDIKYNFNIGKDIACLLNIEDNVGQIKNFEEMDWESDFDTIICGHCQEITKMVQRDFLMEIIAKCIKYNKKIYAYDKEVESIIASCSSFDRLNYYVPGIKSQDINQLTEGRLYDRLTPLVGVFGTSSRQGKFTVQMELRKRFIKQGYSIGQIASEPSGYLFGCGGVFPFGFNSNISVSAEEAVKVINEMLWSVSCHGTKDVILVGGQSGVVPYSHHNIYQYNFRQYEFLCGVNPDVFVLCVNPHDPLDYIDRTIQYLKSFNGTPIAAIVLYPIIYEVTSKIGYGYKQRRLTENEKNDICENIFNHTRIPVYILGDDKGMDCVYNHIINVLIED